MSVSDYIRAVERAKEKVWGKGMFVLSVLFVEVLVFGWFEEMISGPCF
jgi:hypothetical protein